MLKFLRMFIVMSLLLMPCTLTAQTETEEMNEKAKNDLYSQIELFSYALTTIQSEYVDEKTPQDLIYGSLKGMLGSLDPHSQFLDPDDYKDLKTETQGKFGGLGIEISIRDGLLTVVTPLEDTPAWNAGLQAGDRIVKIEDELTKDMSLNDAVKKLRGDPGTKVTITILREEDFKVHEYVITREVIKIKDVKDTMVLEDKIGYVRLTEFREESHKEFRKALDQLQQQGANALILDLRNNPGGLLNVAIHITEEFVPQGEVIVSTKGRHPSQDTVTKSKNTTHLIDWPMVVLINEGSASGSEILAGALKDNNRAVIVGTKSFGKGSVQSVIPLPDGSGLRLTTSKYLTPSGVSIHGTGIVPDVEIKRIIPKKDEELDAKKQRVDDVFGNVELHGVEDKEEFEENKKEDDARERLLGDNQVQGAINVLKGIRVYRQFNDPA